MCFESKSFMFSESPCRLGLASTCRLTHLSLFTLFWTWLTRRQARLICKMIHSAGFASGRWGATKLAQRTRDANAFVGISILKSSWAHGKATDPHKCFGIDFLHFSHPKQVLRHWLSVIPGGTNPGYLPLSQHKRMHSETHGLGPWKYSNYSQILIFPKRKWLGISPIFRQSLTVVSWINPTVRKATAHRTQPGWCFEWRRPAMAPFVVLYIVFLCDPTIGSLGTHFSRINRKLGRWVFFAKNGIPVTLW